MGHRRAQCIKACCVLGVATLTVQAVKSDIQKLYPESNFGVIEADSMDHESMAAMVKQTNVVMSTAGPFWKFVS